MIAHNPFLPSPAHRSVIVTHGEGPYANARRALQAIDLSPARGKRVLLKPNAGRIAAPGTGVTTHPDVIAAAIDALRDAGADVAVGESPILGVQVCRAFEAGGFTAVAAERHCPLLDLDRGRFVELALPEGRAIRSLRVCAEVLDFDLIVSVPVMKTHMHTGVTLAVKNMKGCLWRRSKVELHMLPPVAGSTCKPIDIAIADMASVLRPHLALVDGSVGMEGLGPSAGQAKPLNVVVASADALAADAVACRLMGTAAEQIAHLHIAAQRGYGVIDLDRVKVSPDHWRDWISPFLPPPENLAIEFPDITVLDQSSCSACQSTLLLFLMRHRQQVVDRLSSQGPVHVAIGKGHADLPEGTLCIGNCTSPQQDKGVFVRGCPPVGSQILAALAGETSSGEGGADGKEGGR